MVQLLEPISTITASGYTPIGDSTLNACVDETLALTDGDVTYILSSVVGDVAEVKLSPGILPNDNTNWTISIRTRRTGVPLSEDSFDMSLVQGTTIISTVNFSTAGTSYITLTYTLSPTEVAAISDLTNLRVRLTTTVISGTNRLRISTIEMSIPSTISISGTSNDLLSDSGTVTAIGSISGTSNDPLSDSAVISAKGSLLGLSTDPLNDSANLGSAGSLLGISTCSLVDIGTLTGKGSIAGTSNDLLIDSALLGAVMPISGASLNPLNNLLVYSLPNTLGFYEYLGNLIRTHFGILFPISSTLVQYDDQGYEGPADQIWIRVKNEIGESRQIQFYPKLFRTTGVVRVEFHTPKDSGTELQIQLADILKAAYRAYHPTEIIYNQPSVHKEKGQLIFEVEYIIDANADF